MVLSWVGERALGCVAAHVRSHPECLRFGLVQQVVINDGQKSALASVVGRGSQLFCAKQSCRFAISVVLTGGDEALSLQAITPASGWIGSRCRCRI